MDQYETMMKLKKPFIQRYPIPLPIIYTGKNARRIVVDILEKHNVHSVFIMQVASLRKQGYLDDLYKQLERRNIHYHLFEESFHDPDTEIINRMVQEYGDAEAIVVIGGGSKMDAAKVLAGCISTGKKAEQLFGTMKVIRKVPLLIAIPTTARTGSEATVAAVISDTKTHKKRQVLDSALVPNYAILDPELTENLSNELTVQTAMDALTHALEAYVSTYATAFTDKCALKAIKMIHEYLPLVMKNPHDLIERNYLLQASTLAGVALTRAFVGYVHAFAHEIGARYGISHGLCVGVILPYVMEDYREVATDKLAQLSLLLKLGDEEDSDALLAKKYIDYLNDFIEKVGMPKHLKELQEVDYKDIIEASFKECHGNYPVPYMYDKERALNLLKRIKGRDE